MWTLRRHVVASRFPPERTVLHVRLEGAPAQRRYWWIVVERSQDVDVCMVDPGFPVALTVIASPRTLVDLLLEDEELGDVLRRGMIVLEGERELARRFETLLDFEGGSASFTGGGHGSDGTSAEPAAFEYVFDAFTDMEQEDPVALSDEELEQLLAVLRTFVEGLHHACTPSDATL